MEAGNWGFWEVQEGSDVGLLQEASVGISEKQMCCSVQSGLTDPVAEEREEGGRVKDDSPIWDISYCIHGGVTDWAVGAWSRAKLNNVKSMIDGELHISFITWLCELGQITNLSGLWFPI